MLRMTGMTTALTLSLGISLALRHYAQQPYVPTDLGTLGGSASHAYALNDHGQVVGDAETSDKIAHAFLWQNGKMQDINPAGAWTSKAHAINNRGEVVGEIQVALSTRHAVLWKTEGTSQDLGAGRKKQCGVCDQ